MLSLTQGYISVPMAPYQPLISSETLAQSKNIYTDIFPIPRCTGIGSEHVLNMKLQRCTFLFIHILCTIQVCCIGFVR